MIPIKQKTTNILLSVRQEDDSSGSGDLSAYCQMSTEETRTKVYGVDNSMN